MKRLDKQERIKITSDTVFFFDLDGTLIDTNLANFLAYKKAINSVISSEKDLIYNAQQRFNRSVLKATFPNLTDKHIETIIKLKESYYEGFLDKASLKIELATILFKYSKTNQTFLVTNCRKDRAFKTISYFGLEDKFTNIFCRENDDNGKTINKFQNALSLLRIPPNTVIAFENEADEISYAKKAGIQIINPIIT